MIFSKAALLLAEADTIQKTKELKDMALVAEDWAQRKGMGEAAIQHCRSYAMEAERKMGQMLAQTERAKAGRPPNSVTPGNQLSDTPTLALDQRHLNGQMVREFYRPALKRLRESNLKRGCRKSLGHSLSKASHNSLDTPALISLV